MILYVSSATCFLHVVPYLGALPLSVQVKLLPSLNNCTFPVVSTSPSAPSSEDCKVLYKAVFGLSCLQKAWCGWSPCGSEPGQVLPTNVDGAEAVMLSRISQKVQDSCPGEAGQNLVLWLPHPPPSLWFTRREAHCWVVWQVSEKLQGCNDFLFSL